MSSIAQELRATAKAVKGRSKRLAIVVGGVLVDFTEVTDVFDSVSTLQIKGELGTNSVTKYAQDIWVTINVEDVSAVFSELSHEERKQLTL